MSSTTKPIFLHWVWAFGLNKGRNVDNNHAEDLLRRTGFDKNMLRAVFEFEPSPMHSDSMDLQKILGKIKVSEYGSFVDQSQNH